MNEIPERLKYTKTHEWVNPSQDEVIVGITAHAQQLLGDMVFVELPQVGDTFEAGDEIAVVESVKAASDVYAPISGEVLAVNQEINADPAIVNRDPYGSGWLVKLKATHDNDLNNLLSASDYEKEIAEDH